MSANTTLFRFRPRFVGIALVSLSLAIILIASSLTMMPDRISALFSFVVGSSGLLLAVAYFRSPVWKLAVEIQDDDLVVWNGPKERMRLPWSDVQKVVLGPSEQTCFVDGGCSEHSLLVPGPGASASYDIKNKRELVAAILAHIPNDRIHRSDSECSPAPQD